MATITIPDEAVVETTAVVGADDEFTFSFSFFDDADVLVYKDGVLEVSYTVAGVTGFDGGFDGGTVTLAAAVSSCTIVIERSVSQSRTENFPSTGGLSIAGLNKAFNKTTAWVQELQSRIDRKIGFDSNNEDEPGAISANAATRASKLVGFDGSGDLQLQVPTDLSLSTVTAFADTLLDDGDADTFWATLMATITKSTARSSLGAEVADTAILKSDTTATYTVGYRHQVHDHGNTGTSTLTLDPALGLQQKATCNGSFTFQAPVASSDGFFMEFLLTIDGTGAYTVTLSGFETEINGSIVTDASTKNLIRITRIDDNDGIEVIQL